MILIPKQTSCPLGMYNTDDTIFKIPDKYTKKDLGSIGKEDRWNSLIEYKGKKYRYRVETFVINGDCVYLHLIHAKQRYRIPGGSTDPNVPNIIQAENEVNEESRMKITNIRDTGISYIRPYYNNKYPDESLNYDYRYTDLYIADYMGPYAGKVAEVDADENMYVHGKFYRYSDIRHFLTNFHRELLDEEFLNRRGMKF